MFAAISESQSEFTLLEIALVIVNGVAARLDFGPSGCFNGMPQTPQHNDRENR